MIESGLIKTIADSIVKLHKNIGFSVIRRYVLLGIFVLGLFNIKPILRGCVELVNEITTEMHERKMQLRDDYMTDLTPLLAEFRASVGADRVLYFEFHNSEESLEGMPFKFFDLLMMQSRYGISDIPRQSYRNINASQYTTLFDKIKTGDVILCEGSHDTSFRRMYEGVFELFSESDHSRQQVIFSVPGLRQPVGFVVLEWMDDSVRINLDQVVKPQVLGFTPRINALVIAKKK